MTNFQVYRKTLSFSFVKFLVDLLCLAIVVGLPVAGFFMFNKSTDKALIGLIVGLVIAIIIVTLIGYFVSNRIKAGQIAMMTIGVTEGELPDHTYKAGMNELKGRFAKITLFFVVTNAIKGVFRQLGRGINKIGTAIGGDVGNGITSAIDSAIQTLIGYLCDCCLGWVLYRKDINGARAACEGAVIFFKNGKTLFRNIGRIFGMGILSFILIGGGLGGLMFFIFYLNPQTFSALANEIAEAFQRSGEVPPEFLTNTVFFSAVIAAIGGIILWSIIHSVLIRPFILVGVLRNFMAAGQKNMPTEADFATLDKTSPRFAKLHNSI